MIKGVTILLTVLWSFGLQAQYFSQRYTLGSLANHFNNVIKTDSCIYVLGASKVQDGTFLQKISIVQFDFDGTIKRFNQYELDTFGSYVPTSHSVVFQSNVLNICGGVGPLLPTTALSAKIDLSSFNISLVEYPDTSMNAFWLCGGVILPSGNKVYVGDYETRQYRVGYFMIRTDSDGNELFRKYFPLWSDWQQPSTLNLLRNGNLLIGSEHGNYPQGSHTFTTTQLIEIDTLGNQIKYWHDSIDIGSTFSPCNLVELSNSEKIYASTYLDSSVIRGQWDTDLCRRGYLVKLDSANNKEWQLKLGTTSIVTEFNQMKQLSDGNFLAVGGDVDSFHNPLGPFQAGWLVKFTSSGQVLWQRQYYVDLYYNSLYDFVELDNGDIIACGQAYDYTLTSNAQQGWLLHLDRDGCLNSQCTTGTDDITAAAEITIYPIPTSHTVHIDGITDTHADYTITDLMGRQLQHDHFTPDIDIHTLPTGLYLLDITTSGQHITRRILKE